MGCPGNHEGGLAFAHYTHRFRYMAGDNTSGLTPSGMSGLVGGLPNNHWYSFNVGNAHIAVMSTEAYFFYSGAAAQFAWLEADLAAVDRATHPWLIVFGHRSIYCSCDGDCDGAATTVREGAYGMEALFQKYGVDLFINGHEHDVREGRRRRVPPAAAASRALPPHVPPPASTLTSLVPHSSPPPPAV